MRKQFLLYAALLAALLFAACAGKGASQSSGQSSLAPQASASRIIGPQPIALPQRQHAASGVRQSAGTGGGQRGLWVGGCAGAVGYVPTNGGRAHAFRRGDGGTVGKIGGKVAPLR